MWNVSDTTEQGFLQLCCIYFTLLDNDSVDKGIVLSLTQNITMYDVGSCNKPCDLLYI